MPDLIINNQKEFFENVALDENGLLKVSAKSQTGTGIAYCRPVLSGQIISYRTGDDGWHLANGTYDYTPPNHPEYFARLDTFTTLIDNNAFGDKNRFTDEDGLQVYGNNYIIDHLTGLGWGKTLFSGLWNDNIDTAHNATDLGFENWRVPNIKEIVSIYNSAFSSVLNYTPFNFTTNIVSSSTRAANTTQIHRLSQSAGQITVVNKTSSLFSMKVRNHYN